MPDVLPSSLSIRTKSRCPEFPDGAGNGRYFLDEELIRLVE
jgi:hypothetical protein